MDTKNKHGQTPLMKAVIFDDVEVVKLLHKSGKIYFRAYTISVSEEVVIYK